ncbi:CaiB/BaiF CoA transferase family protein [Halalkalibacter oceani]|uniref:CaiB/BaiF CoA transferase family protein n=1 Tax=Halalkalibacter oceani TaxID=1653776 RepID=UPI0033922B5B
MANLTKESKRTGPLKSLKVIEIANVVAGPFAGSLLADYGADVIKIEMPGVGDPFRQFLPQKDGESLRWATMARNKRCVTLDLRTEKGKDLFLQLVKDADLVLENFRPGTIEKWGIGFDVMKAVNPKIVLARISGYGQDGPYREKAGFGTPATAYSGYTALQGYEDRAPVSPPVALADLMAGMFAVMGGVSSVLAIINGDQAKGQVVDVSLYEPLVRVLESQIADYSINETKPVREPMSTSVASPSYIHKTKDNKWVIIGASTQKTWERLTEVMEMPELLKDPRFITNPDRVKHNDQLVSIIDQWTAKLSMKELVNLLDDGGVPAGPVNEMDDIFSDPHFIARNSIKKVDHPIFGMLDIPNIFPKFSETHCEIRHLGQGVGAFNEEVYKGDLGLSDEEYNQLMKEKII